MAAGKLPNVEQAVTFKLPPSRCEYRLDQQSQFECELARDIQPADYMRRLQAGWRRFGPVVFRPDCEHCRSCLSSRVPVASFRPSETQRRTWRRNAGSVELRIGPPIVTPERAALFAAFHGHGQQIKGWPLTEPEQLALYVANPFPTEEWSYWVDGRLVGVGYVDALPEGLSAVYFFHDPAHHRRSLGTFNILTMIEAARQRGLPHVYLGYYVEGCRSLEYKGRFRPNEILQDGRWQPVVR